MIRLKKLYSEPEIFDPIIFESGLNIILGEKSEESDKQNAVGKSLCIEFINFCLFKEYSRSRIFLIPKNKIDQSSEIKLDLSINDNNLTIIRSIKTPETVTFIQNQEEILFENIKDATDYLGKLYFQNYSPSIQTISFRNLISLLIRDERSEFKNIINPFDTKNRIPDNYEPHLFLLGFGIEKYLNIKSLIKEIDKKKEFIGETKKQIEKKTQSTIKEVKAKINDLDSTVSKLGNAIDQLKNNESFKIVQNEFAELQVSIDNLKIKQGSILYQIKQINSLPEPEKISEKDIQILFNQFKQGLGDNIKKSIDEVKLFKNKIESFRNNLINKRLEDLKKELSLINEDIRKSEERQNKLIELINNADDILKDYKNSTKIYLKKNQELFEIKEKYNLYETLSNDKERFNNEKKDLLVALDSENKSNKEIIQSFEKTILDIHEEIMNNREASFECKTSKNKNIIDFEMRIYDDGSHTNERLKVFMYDLALLLNEFTKKYHPLFLIHDNIFKSDNDSLKKSLNFLYSKHQNSPEEFQYILTITKDEVDLLEQKGELKFNTESICRAIFTKTQRFLKVHYQEESKSNSKSKTQHYRILPESVSAYIGDTPPFRADRAEKALELIVEEGEELGKKGEARMNKN